MRPNTVDRGTTSLITARNWETNHGNTISSIRLAWFCVADHRFIPFSALTQGLESIPRGLTINECNGDFRQTIQREEFLTPRFLELAERYCPISERHMYPSA